MNSETVEAKIKIVFVITSTGVGGAEKMLYHTIKGLDPARFDIRLCSLKEKGFFARSLENDGVAVRCLNIRDENTFAGWLDSFRALILLFIYFMKERPALVHSFLFRANIIARCASFLAGVPVSISSIRVMGGEKKYYHFIERVTAFMVDHYTVVSEQVKCHMVKMSRIDEKKISTIYNGVAVASAASPDKDSLMSACGLKSDDRVLLTAGRLHRQKGYDCLISAMAQVRSSFPGVKLLILGEGEEENNLKKLANSLELRETVIFMGLRPDVEHVIHCIELFVLSSRWEGLPNVLLEAMAAGKPVVATGVGGIPELVVSGVTGEIVPPQDVDALANAIEGLLADKGRAQAMGAAGRERVQRYFSIESMVTKTEALYQELLKRKLPL